MLQQLKVKDYSAKLLREISVTKKMPYLKVYLQVYTVF